MDFLLVEIYAHTCNIFSSSPFGGCDSERENINNKFWKNHYKKN